MRIAEEDEDANVMMPNFLRIGLLETDETTDV